jgi:hypothetical protein
VLCIDSANSSARSRPRRGVAGGACTGRAHPGPARASRLSGAAAAAAAVATLLLAACSTRMPPDLRAPPAYSPGAAPAAPYQRPAMTMNEYRLQFATRLMAANPDITYATPAPEPLLAIPVLEIEVNGDGSVRNIQVVRVPSQATDTVQIAIDAVRRAAPFGDATHLPRPWKFTEVFLFDDDRRFKPRILD